MPRRRFALPGLLLLFAGCGEFGTVNQGQVIDYQRDTGLVTLIPDSNYRDPAHPRFDVLPPVTVQTPENPKEMGPAPEAGKLLGVDTKAHRLAVFNSNTGQIEELPYKELGPASNCGVVDRERKTVAVCSENKAVLVSVADEYLALPEDTWKAGDEIRYYYRDSRRALRLMNVTKTNLNKAAE
jgi:hypothetical protein